MMKISNLQKIVVIQTLCAFHNFAKSILFAIKTIVVGGPRSSDLLLNSSILNLNLPATEHDSWWFVRKKITVQKSVLRNEGSNN